MAGLTAQCLVIKIERMSSIPTEGWLAGWLDTVSPLAALLEA